jgi:hypothetical protein
MHKHSRDWLFRHRWKLLTPLPPLEVAAKQKHTIYYRCFKRVGIMRIEVIFICLMKRKKIARTIGEVEADRPRYDNIEVLISTVLLS